MIIGDPLETIIEMQDALIRIARGRTDCGRPLAAETARQEARAALVRLGISWSSAPKGSENPEFSVRDVRNLSVAPGLGRGEIHATIGDLDNPVKMPPQEEDI